MQWSGRLIGAGIVSATVIGVITTVPGFSIRVFLDPSYALWILGVVTGGVFLSFSPFAVAQAFGDILSGRRGSDSPQLRQSVAVLRRAYQLTWVAGLTGTVLGMIIMLGNLSDPVMLGPGMAVQLVSLVYAALLAEGICKPMEQMLLSKVEPADGLSAGNATTGMSL